MRKKCKILKIEDEEYADGVISIDTLEINGVDHITFGCPKCKTLVAVPSSTLKMFLLVTRKQAGIV